MKNDQIEKVFYRCYDAPDYSAKYLHPPPPQVFSLYLKNIRDVHVKHQLNYH